MGNEKPYKWPSDFRFRRITETLGPTFRPTTSAEIGKELHRSESLVEFYLRSMCPSPPASSLCRTVYRLGPHLWSISEIGQKALGLEAETSARDDYIAWLSVYLDAFHDGDYREEALEVFRWMTLIEAPITFAIAFELAHHPWVNKAPARQKALNVFKRVCLKVEGQEEAAAILSAIRQEANTKAKFARWVNRAGSAGRSLVFLEEGAPNHLLGRDIDEDDFVRRVVMWNRMAPKRSTST